MKRTCLIVSRIKAGLTEKEVAEKIGVSQQTVNKWEKGLSAPKSFKLMKELEALYKVKKECLFYDVFGRESCDGSNGCVDCKIV